MSNSIEEKETSEKVERKQVLKSKCLHERRRRDQENAYFEELAELISASITDMSALSVKPEKSAILQESLNKIKQLKQEKGSSEAVQQSQVSSSKPSVLGTEVLGPLLLEALDGFLFVVNSQGKIDFVSDNVTEYLQYTQDDLVGKSVYNIIHIGDHGQFNNSLLPMSLGSVIPWPSDSSVPKGRTFNCRMLIKPPCDDDDVEVKQTYVSQYENLQISAISQPGEKFSEGSENSEGLSCLVCIARRLSFNEKTNTMLGIEQFTTKQDKNGKIVSHDTSGIVPGHFTCPDFTGQNIQDFCHVNDVQTLAKHFQEVLKTGSNTSSVYRFKLQDNRYIFVQTRSQLFENGNNGEQGFVMSTHSIIRECDSDVELKGSASTSLMKSIIGQSNNIVTNQRNQNIRGIPNSVSPMAVISAMNQPFLNSVSPSIDEVGENVDPFSSGNSWDFMGELGGFTGNSNSGSASVVSNNNNMNFSTGNVSVSSNLNSWNNIPSQMKISSALQQQQQQQMMRNMINMQQQNSEKQRTHPSLNFPRSNSFEAGQKSPSFNSSPSPRSNQFPQPNQRSMHGVMGHPSQRSPGSSMGQNRMSPATSHGYPIQRTPPISSGNQNAPSWGRMQQQQHGGQFSAPQTPTSSMMSPPSDPLAALQNIGGGMSPSPRRTAEFSFPDNLRTNHRQGKLSQLLAGNSPVSGHDPLKGTALESLTSSSTSKDRFVDVTQSPADSMHQSPTPGPGQSPPEKPQSTTNLDDGDNKDIHKNVILKQLLSTDDDEEEETNEAATKEDVEKKAEMEKNEAEPKKPPNALLKKLLSDEGVEKKGQGTESTSSSRDRSRQTSGDLLQILLNEEDNARSSPVIATAESTSHENDLFSRQRHQSGPQEPQSTTTTPTTSQPQANNQALSFPPPQEVTPITSSISDMTKKSCSSNIIGDKNLNSFLESLWEKDNPDSLHMKPNNRKRKISGADSVDSTDMDMGISASQQLKVANNFRNKNVLLAQLLSKRTPSETVVNTSRLLVNSDPCDMPQTRLNVQEKGLSLRPNESKKLQVEKKDVGLKENQHDSLQTLQNSSQFGSVDNSVKTCNSSVSNNVGVSNMTSGSSLAFNNTSSHSNSNLISQSISQSEQNEYDELQKLLDVGSSKESDLLNNTSMDTSDLMCGNSDPLLAEILKQAADLERDHLIEQGNTMSSMSNDMVKTSDLNQVTSNEDLQILSQLDQVLQDPSFSLGTETQVSEDRAAIKRIQNQLMNEDPFPTASNSLGQMANIQSQTPQNNFGMMNSQQGMGSQMGGGMDLQFPHMSNHQQYPQASPNFNHQGSRLPNPHVGGSLASALQQGSQQQQRPVFNSMASQVRHSLLQQQKLKQLREMEKQQMARQQERQRQLMQRQLGQQFNQRFPRNMDNTAVQPLENLGELLNSGTVPNVTLQRNQIPGPMSPRFGLGIQHQQHPNLSQLIQPGPATPNSQMSPHYNQQPQNQWNMRQQQQQQLQQHQQQTSMQSPISSNVPKTNQLLLNRHRSFSGGTMPNNNQPGHFQFPDQNNSQMGLLHQQQQQTMMAQNRMMRQMSLPPGRGSPRAPASPFGNSPDPLLMSPHSSISPRQNPQTSQVSPPFNHTGSLAGSGLGGHQGMTNPQQSSSFQDFDILSELDSKITKTKSQYVKEELRNICNARSDQKQQQNQQAMLQNLPKPAPPPPTQQSEYSELPYDIIEQINEMQQEQQAKSEYNFDDYKEEDVLKVKRQEAKQIYEQFRLLSEKPDTVVAENPEIKASALFRNQLLNPHTINQIEVGAEDIQRVTDQHVQVVTKEPRGNVEDIKPADHSKNSLLQQLLSE